MEEASQVGGLARGMTTLAGGFRNMRLTWEMIQYREGQKQPKLGETGEGENQEARHWGIK